MGGSGALFGEGHCFDNEIDTAGVFLNEVQDMAIQQHGPDVWEWTADPTGQYTSNNAYKVIMGGAATITQEECFVKLWSIKVPRKIAIFARRLIRNRLPTRQSLQRRQVQVADTSCQFCRDSEDDAIFILWTWLRNFEKGFTEHFNHWCSSIRQAFLY